MRKLVISSLLLSLMICGCQEMGSAKRPNVIVICLDAVRPDHLAPYGGETAVAPNIAALAQDAVVFEQAYSVASWTKPSVASLLTGLYPSQHAVVASHRERADVLSDEVVTLAERLRDSGWETAAFVENVHLRADYSALDQGFNLYMAEAGPAPSLVNSFLTWTDRRGKAPFFAYLHILDAHWPYIVSQQSAGIALDDSARLRAIEWDLNGSRRYLLRDAVNQAGVQLDEEDADALKQLYDAEIFDTDAVLGRMIELLRMHGVLANTLIVITGDHGEGFLERGRLDHGYGPYEELLRIPLIMRFPSRKYAGTRVSSPVEIVDIAPTILDYLGLPVPTDGGDSLLQLAADPHTPWEDVVFAEEEHGDKVLTSMRFGNMKYIRIEDEHVPGEPPVVAVPGDFSAGVRVRMEGILAGNKFVADEVKPVGGADTDCELNGPIRAIGDGDHTVDVLGKHVRVNMDRTRVLPEEAGIVFEDLRPFDWVRAHVHLRDDVVKATKIEKLEPTARHEIEIEGIVSGVSVHADGRMRMRLCDYEVVLADRVRWKEFTEKRRPFSIVEVAEVAAPPAVVEELYDLSVDPLEQHNLIAERPDQLALARTRLADMRAQVTATAIAKVRKSVELDGAAASRLVALGYLH